MRIKLKIQNGFTLLELTLVMGIFIVIGTIIVTILNSTFRGNTKVRVSNDVSQNGNYALNLISNLLLNSQSFNSISNGTTITTLCSPTGTTGKSVTVTGFDGGVTTLSCNDSGATPTYLISSASASIDQSMPSSIVPLIDSSQVELAPDSCTFTCSQVDEFSPPRIDIVFTLKNAAVNSAESLGSAIFRTSISLRNQDLK